MTGMKAVAFAATALLGAVPLAVAQTSNSTTPNSAATSATTPNATGGPTVRSSTATGAGATQTGTLSASDRQFLTQDAAGGMYELQISQLAARKSENQAIKDYANMIVTDHTRYDQALQQVAQQNGVTLPATLTEREQTRLTKLQSLNGAAFDKAYVRDVRQANEQDSRASEREESSTQNEQVKQFIGQFKQMDQKHAEQAKALQET